MDRIFVLPLGWFWHEMYLWLFPNEIRPYRTFTLMPSGIVEVQNRSLGGYFPKSAFALWQVRINSCICYYQFSLIVLIMPHPTPIGIRHDVLALAHEVMWQSAVAGCAGLTHPPEACCHWNFGARQFHGGSSEDRTSPRPCFVQDGPPGSLHKCSGLYGTDEKFVWNEGWPENHQQPALSTWLPCL